MSENQPILIVDDEQRVRSVIAKFLQARGYSCETAPSALVALPFITADPQRYSLVLADVMMPDMTGIEFLRQVMSRNSELPVIMISALQDLHTALEAIRLGADDYLVKPLDRRKLYSCVGRSLEKRNKLRETREREEALGEQLREEAQRRAEAMEHLNRVYDFTLEALGCALDLKDSGTEGHSRRVTGYSITIAQAMGLNAEEVKAVARGAYLHDIGKIGIPDSILHKPGSLSPEERTFMQTHCQRGYEIVSRIPLLQDAASIVLCHQECYDGTGYPNGLRGDAIPLGARIFAVADALDAMLSNRPYRNALPLDHAVREIEANAGTQFDPAVVRAFRSLPAKTWLQIRDEIDAQTASRAASRQVDVFAYSRLAQPSASSAAAMISCEESSAG